MHADSTALARRVTPPPMLSPRHRDEWAELSARDRMIVTPEALARWTADLADDDWALAEIVAQEKRRLNALATLRQGSELTDQEWRLLRLLQRREGRTVSYLEIARHLWQTPARRISGRDLIAQDVNSHQLRGPMVISIQTIIHQIRRKLEIDPLRPQHIATLRGVGYRWYSNPPALDDQEDYAERARVHEREREIMRRLTGLVEGEYVEIEEAAADGSIVATRWTLGPEHPWHHERTPILPLPDEDRSSADPRGD